jgi:hypothetical protein
MALRTGVALAGLSAALGLSMAAVPPAQADNWRHTDAAGDTLVVTQFGPETPAVDPSVTQADITTMTVQHSRWSLKVATTIREFDAPDSWWSLQVVTSRGDHFDLGRGASSSEGVVDTFITRNGDDYGCEGMSIHRTPAGVVAKVPRRCLGTPYKVRVGVQTEAEYKDTPTSWRRTAQDDALRTARFEFAAPRLGPWVVGG